MINDWLNKMEERLDIDCSDEFCNVATTLDTLGYPMDTWCLDCDKENQMLCKQRSREIIAKIREEYKWYQVKKANEIKAIIKENTE